MVIYANLSQLVLTLNGKKQFLKYTKKPRIVLSGFS